MDSLSGHLIIIYIYLVLIQFFNLGGYMLIQPDSMQACLLFGESDGKNM